MHSDRFHPPQASGETADASVKNHGEKWNIWIIK